MIWFYWNDWGYYDVGCRSDLLWQAWNSKTFCVNHHLVISVVIDVFVKLLTEAVLHLKIRGISNFGVTVCETGAGENSGAFSERLCVVF